MQDKIKLQASKIDRRYVRFAVLTASIILLLLGAGAPGDVCGNC